MSRNFFDYDDGDFCAPLSDSMAMDSKGDIMLRISDSFAMDMDSGELHMTSSWGNDSDDFGSTSSWDNGFKWDEE